MPFKLKNWKLALLALVFFCFFSGLGVWQLSRAQQKETLLQSFQDRIQQPPLMVKDLQNEKDLRFYRIELTGHFDNQHTMLLDNKTFKGQVGYEVITPFKADGLAQTLLVDRGFVVVGKSRKQLPAIRQIQEKVTISGMLSMPPTYVALGEMVDSVSWPLRVQFLNLPELGTILHTSLFPYLLMLTPHDPGVYAMEWQVVPTMGPERHKGYAVQWFALALTLLVIFVALNRGTGKK